MGIWLEELAICVDMRTRSVGNMGNLLEETARSTVPDPRQASGIPRACDQVNARVVGAEIVARQQGSRRGGLGDQFVAAPAGHRDEARKPGLLLARAGTDQLVEGIVTTDVFADQLDLAVDAAPCGRVHENRLLVDGLAGRGAP